MTGCRLKKRPVDEVGFGLQLLADQIEHPVNHVARSEDLPVCPDTVPRFHELFLDDRLRQCLWLGHMHSSLLKAEAPRQTLAGRVDGLALRNGGVTRNGRRSRPDVKRPSDRLGAPIDAEDARRTPNVLPKL